MLCHCVTMKTIPTFIFSNSNEKNIISSQNNFSVTRKPKYVMVVQQKPGGIIIEATKGEIQRDGMIPNIKQAFRKQRRVLWGESQLHKDGDEGVREGDYFLKVFDNPLDDENFGLKGRGETKKDDGGKNQNRFQLLNKMAFLYFVAKENDSLLD
ncbi:hypothetical protein VNO78_28237 [Psophocarpus tetragonolobus]|uniref:Uncharacterized protein n=1 Tax=Psophocarpus tetragonolobus TaxID=3891 RepID=A0AAN9S2F2_PSOTE